MPDEAASYSASGRGTSLAVTLVEDTPLVVGLP